MKRKLPGLAEAARQSGDVPDGAYLVRVETVHYHWDKQKPFYNMRFTILEPHAWKGSVVRGRLYATVKALWKLSWFLKDFDYDPDLLGRDELDEKALVGLIGVLKLSHSPALNGRSYLNLEAFAPAGSWAGVCGGSDHTELEADDEVA